MFSSVLSTAITGIEVCPVRVEADVSDGLPSFSMVGYVSSQVREAQDRVRTALRNHKISLPPKKITVNLAPADVRKEGSGFDLPVAGAILTALGYLPGEVTENIMMLGELSLNGEVRGVTGVLPSVDKAKELNCRACIIPADNLREGRLIGGIPVIGVHTLEEMMTAVLSGLKETDAESWEEETPAYDLDFAQIHGQELVKRAALIAAGGMHNLLLVGPPGAGKTMIARRIPTIMPPLSREESLEITKIYSIAGLLPPQGTMIQLRPFRAPHHTSSPQALAGGGKIPQPGEVTLAHRSVLFLDELPEFSRQSLEILRQPLEEHQICLSRVHGTYTFPANFMLVAAMNPCPCGYYPDRNRCTCTPADIHRYLSKISAPLLDRIDISVETPAISWAEMTGNAEGQTSEIMRDQVTRVQEIQRDRYAGTGIHYNADLTADMIREYCRMDAKAEQMMKQAFETLALSARAYHRILKVARTIADLEESPRIREADIAEALAYRMASQIIRR